MKYFYLFNASGLCVSASTIRDDTDFLTLAVKNGAANHVVSDKCYAVQDCHYVNGAMVACGEAVISTPPAPLSLAEAKTRSWAAIKLAREGVELAGFMCDGNVYDSDTVSQARINSAAIQALSNPEVVFSWILKNNSTKQLLAADMVRVSHALSEHIIACHAKAQLRRAEISAIVDIAQLAALRW